MEQTIVCESSDVRSLKEKLSREAVHFKTSQCIGGIGDGFFFSKVQGLLKLKRFCGKRREIKHIGFVCFGTANSRRCQHSGLWNIEFRCNALITKFIISKFTDDFSKFDCKSNFAQFFLLHFIGQIERRLRRLISKKKTKNKLPPWLVQ